ncbi:MAG: AmmeMemoRadiSam system protein A [bacterium]
MNTLEQEFLLKLTRESLEYYFQQHDFMIIQKEMIPESLHENRASFVSLLEHEMLRGSTGRLVPVYPLYQDVLHNAFEAAFHDYRFERLNREELDGVQIEISILSAMQPLQIANPAELVNFLQLNKPGLFIKAGFNSANFLPQIWEQISDPEEFLTELCIQAGLAGYHWKNKKLEIDTYTVERIMEER